MREREVVMMYKMKLQELCQKRQWALPKYTCMKCGPHHQPRFGASVSVNGTSFDSLVACKSSKQAHNHVAMLAFLHFTSPNSGSDPSALGHMTQESYQNLDVHSNVSDHSTTITKPDIEKPNAEENRRSVNVQSNAAPFIDDIKFQYKSQLLKYTKQRNLDIPSYSNKSYGADSSCFKASVRVAEHLYESPDSFNTLQEAENDAAKFALMSLLIDNFHTDGPKPYKSLLQELAQGEGLSMPVYNTSNSGFPHKPLFTSFVELEGEIFHGKLAKSKKIAELEAARVAYVTLIERGASRNTELTSTGFAYDSLQNLEQSKENIEANQSDTLSFSAALPQTDEINTSAELDLPSLSISNPNARDDSIEASSYLLHNKVRVYRKFPNRAFPEGIIVLPISDDKWVAVSLEFPN